MKKILVPIDFSDTARNAFRFACLLAERMEAKIILVHIMGIPMTSPYAQEYRPEIDETMMKDYKSNLVHLIRSVANESDASGELIESLKIETVVKVGFAVPALHSAVADLKADLIVMGTHGRTGFKAGILGSVTSMIVKNAKVPVVSVPGSWENTNLTDFALAVDDLIKEECAIWSFLEALTNKDHTVSFLHVVEEKNATLSGVGSKMLEYYKANKGEANAKAISISGKEIVKTLEGWCKNKEVDMLLAIKHKHSFLESITSSSTTRALVLHNMMPVMVFPESYALETHPAGSDADAVSS